MAVSVIVIEQAVELGLRLWSRISEVIRAHRSGELGEEEAMQRIRAIEASIRPADDLIAEGEGHPV